MLEQLTASGSADSFAWYALALEYQNEGRLAEALQAFETLYAKDPSYLPMYLMAGQMLIAQERLPEARTWLERGKELARQTGEAKVLSEIDAALALANLN
jgi:predicted Zn-dependent protease